MAKQPARNRSLVQAQLLVPCEGKGVKIGVVLEVGVGGIHQSSIYRAVHHPLVPHQRVTIPQPGLARLNSAGKAEFKQNLVRMWLASSSLVSAHAFSSLIGLPQRWRRTMGSPSALYTGRWLDAQEQTFFNAWLPSSVNSRLQWYTRLPRMTPSITQRGYYTIPSSPLPFSRCAAADRYVAARLTAKCAHRH